MKIYLIFLLTVVSFIINSPADVDSQQGKKVTVRAAKHPSYIRVVFTADEDIIKRSSVILQKDNTIKIDLKLASEIEVQPYGLLKNNTSIEIIKGLKISLKDNYHYLTSELIDDIEVSKLTAPHRLVIDIYMAKSSETKEKPPIQEIQPSKQADDKQSKPELVVIDAGHGGDDRGLVGSRFVEKDFVQSFVKELSANLGKKGIKTLLTRKGDQRLLLKDRIAHVKDKRFDVFISFHVSSTEDLIVYNLSRPDNNPKDIAKEAVVYFNKTLANKVSVKESPIIPYFHKNLKKGGLLIELPNPDKFNYDKKTKDLLYTSIVNFVLSFEPQPKE